MGGFVLLVFRYFRCDIGHTYLAAEACCLDGAWVSPPLGWLQGGEHPICELSPGRMVGKVEMGPQGAALYPLDRGCA